MSRPVNSHNSGGLGPISFHDRGQYRESHRGLRGLLGRRGSEGASFAPRTVTERGSDSETSGSGETAAHGTFN